MKELLLTLQMFFTEPSEGLSEEQAAKICDAVLKEYTYVHQTLYELSKITTLFAQHISNLNDRLNDLEAKTK